LRKAQQLVKDKILSKFSKFQDAFKFIDKDSSGAITREELLLNLDELQLGTMIRQEVKENLIDFIDMDDGGKIEFKEYARVFTADDVMTKAPLKPIATKQVRQSYGRQRTDDRPGSGGSSARGHSPAGSVSGQNSGQNNQKFAWNSDRITHELVCKFDQFTRRREDHMRKLLWTFGSDPAFENADSSSAIRVSPKNFNRVCDRFGLVCTEQQAQEIFTSHGLPKDGCNMYTLAKTFLNTNDANPGAHKGRRRLAPVEQRARTADPFKLARLPDNAWRSHMDGAAANAPFATTLPVPPIAAAPAE